MLLKFSFKLQSRCTCLLKTWLLLNMVCASLSAEWSSNGTVCETLYSLWFNGSSPLLVFGGSLSLPEMRNTWYMKLVAWLGYQLFPSSFNTPITMKFSAIWIVTQDTRMSSLVTWSDYQGFFLNHRLDIDSCRTLPSVSTDRATSITSSPFPVSLIAFPLKMKMVRLMESELLINSADRCLRRPFNRLWLRHKGR